MTTDRIVEITMPQMGESVSEGTVLEWHKQVGDPVAADELVLEVSTDKVDAEVTAPAAGTITEILVHPDETVPVGTALAQIAVSSDTEAAPAEPSPERPAEPSSERSAEPLSEPAAEGSEGGVADGRQVVTGVGNLEKAGEAPSAVRGVIDGDGAGEATPVAERVASAHGVDLSRVRGSGPRGRVTKSDVVAAIAGDGPPQGANGSTPIRGSAAMLVKVMNESRSIPTATSFRTLAVDVLDTRRSALKAAGKKLSFTHLIAWAIVQATRDVAVMAHAYAEIDGVSQRVVPAAVNLGLAVDVERKDGTRALVVPVLHAADQLDFAAFVARYDELVAGARANALPAEAYQGATITLTNPGGIGTVASVPRLMPGQGTIVATGAIAYPAGLAQAGAEALRDLGVSKVMTMTSTYDHRVIQGAESGAFLRQIDELLRGGNDFYETVFDALGAELPRDTASAGAPAAGALSSAHRPDRAAVAPSAPPEPDEALLQAVQAATSVVKAHRMHGHLAARLDPLGSEPVGDPALDPDSVGLTAELMSAIPASILRVAVPGETFAEALPALEETYRGTIAYEIEHISDHKQRVWLRETIESGRHREQLGAERRRQLLERLSQVEALESYLHRAFLGKKQFSIEGIDMLVPMLDETIELASTAGTREVILGMAHRGRLNVLAHTVGRPYETILVEFEGEQNLRASTALPEGGTGDVKYHHGASGTHKTATGKDVTVTLSPNPSHLEFVDPIVEGRVRADQTTRKSRELAHDPNVVLPVLIHGDAAFPGQGIVAETLNLQALEGYTTGGTLHIITNNQLGFTTDPGDARSTRYASDLAKGFDVPIIHVNADDVEACIAAVRLAMAFRDRFKRDALIDLIGYRRFGHNETDEPAYTQPLMYQRIKGHPPVRKLYADALTEAGVVSSEEVETIAASAYKALVSGHESLKAALGKGADEREPQLDRSASAEPRTAVSAETLRALNEQLVRVPDGFALHRKLKPQLERRRSGLDDGGGGVDWAQAEALALASLVCQGVPIRLTGQDTERGTFSQRHLVFHDAKTGERYRPIQNLPDATVPCELHNSPLSESACLAFEYGYSAQAPDALVLWEAQFGDFVNAAQVIVDQFLVSGLAKWGQTTRLTLLLPHGYEGSGPEHSSGRLERFLQLASEGNIRVANPSTPAQYFHLLRRQALVSKQRPLVVMTPKSLLRLTAATSTLAELTDGAFQYVLDDPTVPGNREAVTRLVLCSGKVYYDIVSDQARADAANVAVGRVELLYPFARNELRELMRGYPSLKEVVWVQEEPRNMGANWFIAPKLTDIVPAGTQISYIGRQFRASPGEGYPAAHRAEQARIVHEAFGRRAEG